MLARRSTPYYRPNTGYTKGYSGRAYGLDKPSMPMTMSRSRYGTRSRYGGYGARYGYGRRPAYSRYGSRYGYSRVKELTLKLTALQTYQNVDVSYLQSDFGQRTYVTLAAGSSDQFRSWGIVLNNNPRKVYVRSLSNDTTFTNANNFPVRMTTYQLQARENIDQSMDTMLNDAAPSPRIGYMDPTTSALFRRYFEITARDDQFISPGKAALVKFSKFFQTPKLITGDVEGDTGYTYTPVSTIMLCFFDAVPCTVKQSAEIGVRLPQLEMTYVGHQKITYYVDESALPDSSLDTDISTTPAPGAVWTDLYPRVATSGRDTAIVPYPPPAEEPEEPADDSVVHDDMAE